MVAVGSAFTGALGGPVGVEDEDERCFAGGGFRVAIVVVEVDGESYWLSRDVPEPGDCGVWAIHGSSTSTTDGHQQSKHSIYDNDRETQVNISTGYRVLS